MEDFEKKFNFSVDEIKGKCFELNEQIPTIYFRVIELKNDNDVVGMEIDRENLWISLEHYTLESLIKNYNLITFNQFNRIKKVALMDLGDYNVLDNLCELIVKLKSIDLPLCLIYQLCMAEDDLAMIYNKACNLDKIDEKGHWK